jgi:glycosyltransferase involved in cell wall biosynthesis
VTAPTVSVVVPTRNRWRLLADALASVWAQEDVSVETVVVDDASDSPPPRSLEQEIRARGSLLVQGRRTGAACARNQGIAAARGEWVAFLDDDDLWAPAKLRLQLEACDEADAAFAYTGVVLVDQDASLLDVTETPGPEGLHERLLRANELNGSTTIVRTEVVRAVGGFDEHLALLADWDLWLRITDVATAAYVPAYLVAYRQHSANMVVAGGHLQAEFEYLSNKHREDGKRHGVAFDAVSFDRWLAWGARRAGDRRTAARIYARSAVRRRNVGNLLRAGAVLVREWSRPTPPDPGSVPGVDWLKRYRAER